MSQDKLEFETANVQDADTRFLPADSDKGP